MENDAFRHWFDQYVGGFTAGGDAAPDVVNAKIVEACHVKNLNDFKLFQIGWVFDINFTPALQQVRDRGYVESICRTLPPCDRLTRIERAVAAWFDKKIGTSQPPHIARGH